MNVEALGPFDIRTMLAESHTGREQLAFDMDIMPCYSEW